MKKSLDEVKKRIKSISASNRNALYDSHIYWSQKPYNICDILIESFSEPGEVIFDPFLGSGVTIFEAIKNENMRIGVGCEINDAPVFIVNTLLNRVQKKDAKAILEDFIEKVQKLQPYYNTICTNCGKSATITSVIFDRSTRFESGYIKVINYKCECINKGNKIPSEKDTQLFESNEPIENIADEMLIFNTKIAVYENQKISDIFTHRNFIVLDKIVGIIKTYGDFQDILKYILMSVLHLCKITDKHSNSQWPLWTPKIDCVEKNVIDTLTKKVEKFLNTMDFINKNYNLPAGNIKTFQSLNPGQYILLQKGSQNITSSEIPSKIIDLIITDPPYMGQVTYSEYMQLYKPFLGFDFNLKDEIIVSSAPSRNKNEDEYFKLLDEVFAVCSDKLKDDKYMCMYFHDCNLDVWNKLINVLSKNCFRYISQVYISKPNTLKNIISPKKSLNGDSILFFVKDRLLSTKAHSREDIEEIETNIVRHIKHIIKQNGPQSTPELYDDGLMETIIHNGWLPTLADKYKTLVEIFENYLIWDADLCKWKSNQLKMAASG